MRRRLLIAPLSLLALLLIIWGSVLLALHSESGSRWLLGRVPGLQVEGFDGRLGSSWTAEKIVWQQGEQKVEVDAPSMQWRPACLLRATLCIEHLRSGLITLDFPPSDAPDDNAPFSLPELNLPLAIELGEIKVAGIRLNGADQAQGLELAANWTQQGLQIGHLRVKSGDVGLSAKGHLQPTEQWPLALKGQLTLPAPDQQGWDIDLDISGNLREQLELKADSRGYLQGHLNGSVEALAEELPANLRLQIGAFKASADLPDTLTLQKLDLTAKGSLADGYKLVGKASLPAEEGPVDLALKGVVNAVGAKLETLSLAASAEQYVRFSGEVDWSKELAIDSSVKWQDFPWLRLYPMDEPPQILLKALNAEVSYRGGDYLGNFAAQLDGPAGAFSVQSPVSGNLQRVHLPDLLLKAGEGAAQGQVAVGFADKPDWDVRLQLSQLDPGYWLAEMPGRLAGVVNSKGDLSYFTADVQLDGQLRGQPAKAQVHYAGGLEQGELNTLEVSLGENRIQGRAALQQQLSGQLMLDMPRLGQLWPGLQGVLRGRVDVAGTLQHPQGNAQLQGERLAYDGQRMKQLSLEAALNAGGQARLQVDAQGIRSGDNDLGRLVAKLDGSLEQQRLQMTLNGPMLNAEMALSGVLAKGDWQGQLSTLQLQVETQDWRLQQPAYLNYMANGVFEMGALCLRSGEASLCAGKQRLMPDTVLDLRLSDFPMASLKPWLPDDFDWQGLLNGEVKLTMPASGPDGYVRLDAGRGTWRIKEQDQWLDFVYDSLRLDAQLKPQQVTSTVELKGPKLGQVLLKMQIDPRAAAKPVHGSFDLKGFDLAIARPFAPMVERVVGQLNGSGSIGGSLLAPQINGSLRIVDGEISGGDLPMDLKDLQLVAQIDGQRLRLDGGWRSGEVGQGKLQGDLNWAAGMAADVSLSGQRLPVNVEPYAALVVEPDLRVQLVNDQLSITGRVAVPSGAIEVRELPPSTVQVSSDAEVVGTEKPEAGATAIAMDIDVEVGQETLTFKGFGLTAELLGRVHVGNDLETRGELSLNKGRFRAYGQRLNIRRARVFFTGPIDQPFLDVEAIRKVDEVTAGLRLTGSAAQPKTEVFSEPAMSQEQALSYLVLGRPMGQNSGDNNMLAQAALALGMAGSAPVLSSFAEGLGIKDFQLDTQGSGATTSVVASGNLSDRLSLRYGVGVFEPANTIALRYELTRRVFLEAASGLASSLDIFYRRDF